MVASSTAPVPRDHHPTPWVKYAWGVTLTLLLLACIAVWHISLLWLYREGPSVLGSWLMTIFVLVLATRQVARQVAPPARSFLMRHFARLDAVGVVFVGFLLLLLLLFHLGFERAASDGRSYFVQVRSLVMDWDLDFANDEAGVWRTRREAVRLRCAHSLEPLLHPRPCLAQRVESSGRRSARRRLLLPVSAGHRTRDTPVRIRRSRPHLSGVAEVFLQGTGMPVDAGVVRHLVPDLVSHRRQFDGARRLDVRDHAVPLPLAPISGRSDTSALGLAWCRRGPHGHGAVAEQRVRGASSG